MITQFSRCYKILTKYVKFQFRQLAILNLIMTTIKIYDFAIGHILNGFLDLNNMGFATKIPSLR